jgi:hypothetical protein
MESEMSDIFAAAMEASEHDKPAPGADQAAAHDAAIVWQDERIKTAEFDWESLGNLARAYLAQQEEIAAWKSATDASQLRALDAERKCEAQQQEIAELRRALESIAESRDAGRHDGKPEPYPAHTDVEMWLRAQEALARKETP